MALDFQDYEIIQRGFGGSQFEDLVGYTNNIVLPYQPAAVVVWEGTNDIASGEAGAEVFADYQQFVSLVHAAQPGVDIFYLGITPTPSRWGFRAENDAANAAIEAMAQTDARLHYIDLPSEFYSLNPPSDSAFTSLYVDGLHLTREGYDLWTSIVRPAIEAVIPPNKSEVVNPQAPGLGARILFDFGPSNPEDGDPTVSPDSNGNTWNNWRPATGEVAINAGEHIGGLVTTDGAQTGIGMVVTGGFSSNGKLNGGLAVPDAGLLGELAVATATQDYFFSQADDVPGGGNDDVPGGFMLTGLDPALAYDFRFFGSRSTTQTRVAEYRVTGRNEKSTTLQSSGSNIGSDNVYDGNDDAVALIENIKPDEFGQVFVDLTVISGGYAYLNAMQVDVVAPVPDPVEPTRFALIDFGPSGGVGVPAPSPDAQGNIWNNISGTGLSSILATDGVSLGAGLQITSAFAANSGGLPAPSLELLGDFAVPEATTDFYFVSGADTIALSLTGLDPDKEYGLEFFGSKENFLTQETRYTITHAAGTDDLQLVTSGFNLGSDGVFDGNDNTVVGLQGLRADASRSMQIVLEAAAGGNGYLNAMRLTAVPPNVCPADINGDGILDNGDIGGFITLFLEGDLGADRNGDGILDNGDIGTFVTQFIAGC